MIQVPRKNGTVISDNPNLDLEQNLTEKTKKTIRLQKFFVYHEK